MKYIFIAYVAFNGFLWWPSWQMLPPVTFENSETCSRYMNEVVEDLEFHKKHNQNGVYAWHMTCHHYWETDADHQKFLDSINGPKN